MADRNAVTTIQTGFSAGELSESLFGRVDLAKYSLGAARLRNMFVDIRGGASSRPGTQMITEIANSALPGRLIPFAFSTEQTYMLELGHYTLRVITNGAVVLSGGVPYSIVSPWSSADLWRLRFTQSADVMTICHPEYAPYDLTRTGATAWTLTKVTFGTSTPTPGAPTVVAKVGAAATTYRYMITAQIGSEESLPSAAGSTAVAAVMSVNGNEYMTITWGAVAKADLYNIYRQEELPSGAPDLGALYGLVGTTQGLVYQDRNGQPDYSKGPPIIKNPFAGGAITAIAITAGGAGYGPNTYLTVSDATGQGFRAFPVLTAGVWTSTVIQAGGWSYTAPTFTLVDPGGGGAGAVAGAGAIVTPYVPGTNDAGNGNGDSDPGGGEAPPGGDGIGGIY